MKGRLNLFQATMRRWRELHPYNAVHVVTVEQPFAEDVVRAAVARTLEAWGLTGLTIAGSRYEYREGPARFEFTVLAGGSDPMATVSAEIERQLNRPFPREGPLDPFRVFVVDQGDSYRVGLAYDHFIAAGDSIVLLLKEIFERCSGREPSTPPPERYPPRCARMLARQAGDVLRGLRRMPGLVASCRASVRPRYRDPADGHNGFFCFTLDAHLTAAMKQAGKAAGVTLNDLLLALMLAAVAPLAGPRDPARRRHEIGVASIVNIRASFGPAARAAFGQFLASFRVSHPFPPGTPVVALARDLHAQTRQVKREKLYLQSLLAMAASELYWPFLTADQRVNLHAKSYPTLAGISNLDVGALWGRPEDDRPPDYLRAVPTGPLSPLVLAVTSSRDVLHVGVSFRTAAVDRSEVATMSGLFVELAGRLAA